MFGVGKDLCGSSSPTFLPKQGHLQQAAQDLVQAGLEYLQRRRLHNLPGQPVPVLHHPQREEVLPHVQTPAPSLKPERHSLTLPSHGSPSRGVPRTPRRGWRAELSCCPPALPLHTGKLQDRARGGHHQVGAGGTSPSRVWFCPFWSKSHLGKLLQKMCSFPTAGSMWGRTGRAEVPSPHSPGTPSSAAKRCPKMWAQVMHSSMLTFITGTKGQTSRAPMRGCSPEDREDGRMEAGKCKQTRRAEGPFPVSVADWALPP